MIEVKVIKQTKDLPLNHKYQTFTATGLDDALEQLHKKYPHFNPPVVFNRGNYWYFPMEWDR